MSFIRQRRCVGLISFPALLLLMKHYRYASSLSSVARLSSIPTIEDAIQRFRLWDKQGSTETQEFRVESRHLDRTVLASSISEGEDESETQQRRDCTKLARFASMIAFPDTIQSVNAANNACRNGQLRINDKKVSGARRVVVGDVLTLAASQGDRRTRLPVAPSEEVRTGETKSTDKFGLKESNRSAAATRNFCHRRMTAIKILSDKNKTHSPLRVLFEDDVCAIVCKPAGIHSVSWKSTMGKNELALDDLLPLLLQPPQHSVEDALPAPLPRHRLDARVSGPVAVAKTKHAMVELSRQFQEEKNKTITKEYRAILVGRGTLLARYQVGDSFLVDSPLEDKSCITNVTVLDKTKCPVDGELTDVMLFPITGRRHQLRRHCAEVLGAPILGDDLYTGTDKLFDSPAVTVRRGIGLFLYCRSLQFQHPIDSSRIVHGEIPEPFRFKRHREKARKGYLWRNTEGS